MSESQQKIEEFKRKMLQELLDQCTEPQKELFGRIYPNGVSEDKLMSAIDLCERTVKKNKAGRVG